jgi:hypothetical protein
VSSAVWSAGGSFNISDFDLLVVNASADAQEKGDF